jgi:threonylcarbamoyladenosine tRNA methylthiotransferase MtaB
MVVGAKDKFRIHELLKSTSNEDVQVYSCDINDVDNFQSSYASGERTRAFLKVQDGCNYSCTYCTIPMARGRSRSDTVQNIVRQANEIAELGIKEVVLSGVNIGDFGYSNGFDKRQESLIDLLQALDCVDGIERFRISSIEPNLLSDAIIEFVANAKKFVPHFHIPMQSGSDAILKKMKRRYLTALYRERLEKIKSLMPHAGIGADVIVGFPGETDTLFQETYQFVQSLPLSYLHVFTYSERSKTEAADMRDVIPTSIRQQRNKILRQLSDKKRNTFIAEHLGTKRSVLWESENDGGYMLGYTDNYIRVRKTYDQKLVNTIQIEILKSLIGSEVAVDESSALNSD